MKNSDLKELVFFHLEKGELNQGFNQKGSSADETLLRSAKIYWAKLDGSFEGSWSDITQLFEKCLHLEDCDHICTSFCFYYILLCKIHAKCFSLEEIDAAFSAAMRASACLGSKTNYLRSFFLLSYGEWHLSRGETGSAYLHFRSSLRDILNWLKCRDYVSLKDFKVIQRVDELINLIKANFGDNALCNMMPDYVKLLEKLRIMQPNTI